MKFSEILKEKRDNFEVILGYNDNDNLKINIKDNPSILITGSTGTSKSIMMHEILLELINKNPCEKLKIIPISPTRVELKCYAESNYSYCNVMSNKDIAMKVIDDLVEKRENLLIENYAKDFDSYNNIEGIEKIPFIVIAIDEASDILSSEEGDKFLNRLIRKCKNLGIAVIINTNNVYNTFFDNDDNELYFYQSYLSGNWYKEQAGLFQKLKKVWRILRNKDYYYSEICMTKEDWEEFKEWVNSH